MTRRCQRLAYLLLVAITALVASVQAHDMDGPAPRVYAAAKDGKILGVDFAHNTTEVINTDFGPGIQLQGLVLRDDQAAGVQLIVANRKSGVKIYFHPLEDVAGQVVAPLSQIAQPDALALGTGGILFVTGDHGRVYRIARGASRPGGYGTLFQMDGSLPSEHLVATEVVRFNAGGLDPGDLLVAGRERPAVFRYANAASCGPCPRQEFIPKSGFPKGAKLSGLTFVGQTLLVALEGGSILRYNPSGIRQMPDFASGLGPGSYRIAAGPDGFVYVTRNHGNGQSVRRYSVAANGTGSPAGTVTAGVVKPEGVANTTANVVSFLQNQASVVSSYVSELNCESASWTDDGVLASNVLVFEDPREAEACVNPPGPDGPHASCADSTLPLHRGLNLQEIDPAQPDVVIPSYIRALRKRGSVPSPLCEPETGPPVFIVVTQDTDETCTDPPETHGEEEVVMGYDPGLDCPLDRSAEARWAYAPSAGEPPLLEDPIAIEITSGIGSTRGHSKDTSVFVHGRNTRPLDGPGDVADATDCLDTGDLGAAEGVVDCGLVILKKALAASETATDHFNCINEVDDSTLDTLRELVNIAIDEFDDEDYDAAKDELEEFEDFIKDNQLTLFTDCEEREGPELRARALSLIYMLGKL
jgi:hypothetical protein